MASMTTAEANQAATNLSTNYPYASLYTTAPTQAAAGTEVTGGAPAYARKLVVWGAATGGVITGTCTFDVPTAISVVGLGLNSLVTAGVYGWGATVTTQAYASQGTYAATITVTFA